MLFSGETLAFYVQGSVQWITVLQSASGETIVFSAQGFLLWITVILVVSLSRCVCVDLRPY